MKVGKCVEVGARTRREILTKARQYTQRNSTGALLAECRKDRRTVLIIRRE